MAVTKSLGPSALAVRRIKLLPAVMLTLVGLAIAGVLVWVLFTRLLRGDWPWQIGALDEDTPGKDTTQIVLTVVAGLGAAVALVVAYRRQRDSELARFDERFASAAAQLGAGSAAERLAGVYATAALADTWEQHRQQCIDVLCGYLRLPYDPSAGLLKTVSIERKIPLDDGSEGKETRTNEHLPNDRHVRLTIISTLTSHLRPEAPVSWQGHDFNFTGATFDGGDFGGAVFSGGTVTFDGAQFQSSTVNFGGAQFVGGVVTFREIQVIGGMVTFRGARFTSGTVTLRRAQFTSGTVTFRGAHFAGGDVYFNLARFDGGAVDFNGAHFNGGLVNFNEANFDSGTVNFDSAQFTGLVTFDRGRFTGGAVRFNGAHFNGGAVTFKGARFTAGTVNFRRAEFTTGTVNFDKTRFTGGGVFFNGAKFLSGAVTFNKATFTAGTVAFREAQFSAGMVNKDGEEFRGWPAGGRTRPSRPD